MAASKRQPADAEGSQTHHERRKRCSPSVVIAAR
jgi:hypothetical protein